MTIFNDKIFSERIIREEDEESLLRGVEESVSRLRREESVLNTYKDLGLLDDKNSSNLIRANAFNDFKNKPINSVVEKLGQKTIKERLKVPFDYPDKSQVNGNIPIAKFLHKDFLCSYDLEDFFQQCMVIGPTGVGKTNLLATIIRSLIDSPEDVCVIVFDTKKGDLVRIFRPKDKGVIIRDFLDDFTAPTNPVKKLSPHKWFDYYTQHWNNIFSFLNELLWGNVVQQSLIQETLKPLIRKGFYSRAMFPLLGEIARELLLTKGVKSITRNDKKSLIISKFYLINESLKKNSDRKCLDVDELVNNDFVVADVSRFSEPQQVSMIANITTKLVEYKTNGSGVNNDKSIILVYDEAMPLLSKNANTISGIPTTANNFATTRYANIGNIASVQNPSQIHPIAIGNSSTQIVFRQTGEESLWCEKNYDLNKNQKDYLRKMGVGTALLSCFHKKIFLAPVCFPLQEWKIPTDLEERIKKGEELYKPAKDFPNLCYEPSLNINDKKSSPINDLSMSKREINMKERVRKALEIIGELKIPTLMELYDSIGLSPKQGVIVKKFMEEHGYIKIHNITTDKKEIHFKIPEITKAGVLAGQNLGIILEELPGRGFFHHRQWQHRIKKIYEKKGFKVYLEGCFSQYDRADVSVVKNDYSIAIEVEFSSKNSKENISRNLKNQYDEIVMVATTKRVMNEIQNIVDSEFPLFKERIVVRPVSYYCE